MVLFWSGIIFSNGENWKEMRRFALSNLRDFGMGKRGSEEKIIEEIEYLKGEFDTFEGMSWDTHGIMLLVYKIHWEKACYFLFTGKPFDTTQPVNYAVSNIISSIVYGSRFEYTDPQFTAMVDRANENVRVGGSISMMVSIINKWTKTVFWPQKLQNLLFTYKAPIMKVHFRLNQSLLCPFLALQHISMVKSVP